MLRRDFRCPKCEGIKIGHLASVPDLGDHAKARASDQRAIGRMYYHDHEGDRRMQRMAPVEAYVCTECGYFEEYVINPEAIPWDTLAHFQWCRGTPTEQTPYRSE